MARVRRGGLRKRGGRRGLRRRGRKFAKKGGQISLLRGPAGIPDKVLVKFNYAGVGQINTAQFSIDKQYRLNSIYDPEFNLGGQSVAGLAQWSALYQKYRVYKVDYLIQLVNAQGAQSIAGAVVPAPAGFTLYSYGELATQPYAKSFLLAPVQGMNRRIIKGSVYLPKLEGQSNVQFMSLGNNSSTFNTNPASTNFLYLITQNVDNGMSGTPNVLQWSCKLTYHCELFERKSTYVNTFNTDDEDIGRRDLSGNLVPNTLPILGPEPIPAPALPPS